MTIRNVEIIRDGKKENSYWTFPRGKLDTTKEQNNNNDPKNE